LGGEKVKEAESSYRISSKGGKHALPVRRHLEFAQSIVDSASAKTIVPNTIYTALCGVISMRKTTKVVLGHSFEHLHGEDGHDYIIEVLENI